ncbi:hypothetical protein [Neobacillus cucumis]|jgi:hypothetical protein|uniref:hypothetical protein n=1 Tax=Neobacillus cucumis TaxID=1740721 RepID=UPI002E1E1E8D|nr:hypothetical protein [Neobacillus cucumis]
MLKKIEAIKQALECECYLPALALALTIPDICGQIEYPNYVDKNGNRLVGKQYRAWFNDWVNHRYADPSGWTGNYKRAKNPFFTGRMCYDLRCSFLHSGNLDINDFGKKEDEKNRYSYNFELCVNGCNSFGEMWEYPQKDVDKIEKIKCVRIDVGDLCNNLCLSAEEYYQYKNEEAFVSHKIKIIDIQAENNKLNLNLSKYRIF